MAEHPVPLPLLGRHCSECRSSRWPPIGSDDAHSLLVFAAQPQLGGAEQPVDDQDVLVDAGVDEFGLAGRADDEQRRHLALDDAAREFDIDPSAVVIDGDRPPCRAIRSEEHTSELQSLMRISYAVFCLKKK